jgi:hypothetical protein
MVLSTCLSNETQTLCTLLTIWPVETLVFVKGRVWGKNSYVQHKPLFLNRKQREFS